jgi:hypothetical protein
MKAMNTFLSNPPGRNFVRGLIARTIAGESEENIVSFARGRWGHQADQVIKSAVAALNLGQPDLDAREFFGLVREQSVLGRLVGLRRVPFNVRMLSVQTGSNGYWVSQAAPKPLSKPTLAGSVMGIAKVVAILVTTKEMVDSSDPAVEDLLQDDLLRGLTVIMDQALLDPANGGSNGMPASISNGATVLTASGDFAADLRALIAAFRGDLSFATFVSSPEVATAIATKTDDGGRYLFPGIGPRGGELLGIPVVTCRAAFSTSNGGVLTLVDASGIAAALGSVSLEQSGEASLVMSDDPSDPAVATQQVSLWQTNSIGFRAELFANWNRQRPGSVVVLEGL